MRGLRSLPPSFLLPAWNRTHILQLAVNHHSKPSKVPKQQVAASSSARELNRDGLDQELRSKLGADERGILHRAEDERRSTGEAQLRTRQNELHRRPTPSSLRWEEEKQHEDRPRGLDSTVNTESAAEVHLRPSANTGSFLAPEEYARLESTASGSRTKNDSSGFEIHSSQRLPDIARPSSQRSKLSKHNHAFTVDKRTSTTSHKTPDRIASGPRPTGSDWPQQDTTRKRVHGVSRLSKKPKEQKRHKPNLVEELFPEQAKVLQKPLRDGLMREKRVPLLEPPQLDQFHDASAPNQSFPQAREASFDTGVRDTSRIENLAVLILDGGNPNLCEADFRRVAPKGWHIGEWRGREDPLQVIPARDENTLLFQNCYYLVFPNLKLAEAYKSRAEYLHKLSQAHTPTTLHSPLLPLVGTIIDGEDAGSLLREYALAPPSQPLSLHLLSPPYKLPILRMLAAKGTVPLTHPTKRSGRAVLLWVDGYQPTTNHIQTMLARDGQDRGMPWSATESAGAIQDFNGQPRRSTAAGEGWPESAPDEEHDEEPETSRGGYRRWLVSFEDETEARRFIRAWHKRPFPVWQFGMDWEDGEPLPLLHTEFMW